MFEDALRIAGIVAGILLLVGVPVFVVLGTMTSERRRRGEFGAWSGLDDAPAERHRLRFTVERAGTGTAITISSEGATGLRTQTVGAATTRERRRPVDRLADWLQRARC